jgi:hypothetical protein
MVKTSPEVEAMQTKPRANLPDGSWNPAYGKWHYWKNREEQLRKAKEYRVTHKEEKQKWEREYREKHGASLRRKDRVKYLKDASCKRRKKDAANAWYKNNKEHVLKKRREYHQKKRSDPKYVRRRRVLHAMTYRGTRKTKNGFIYFFRTITPGFYKAGCTENWKQRKRTYKGANSIDRLFFVRPVKNPFFAETMLKIFLEGNGYTKFLHNSNKNLGDWFIKKDELVFKLA